MKNTHIIGLLLPVILLAAPQAQGQEGVRLSPVDHPATLTECGACHMVYPPQMLPARSWQALMDNLPNHFNEDATLAPEVQKDITTYLLAMAADGTASTDGARFVRGLDDAATPLRITEMPFWIRAHDEVSAATFARPDIKLASKCQACHLTADKGEFFEVEEGEGDD